MIKVMAVNDDNNGRTISILTATAKEVAEKRKMKVSGHK